MPILANQRHERFAQLVASGETGAAAYRQTYHARGKSAEAAASRLLGNVRVRERVRELQSKVEKETLLTMRRRRELLQRRAENPNITDTALVAVLLADARLAGELVDKQELTGQDGTPLPSAVPTIIITRPPEYGRRRG